MNEAKLIGALVVALAFASLVGWALWERGERLQCNVALVAAVDQGKILEKALERQGKSIEGLGKTTAAIVARTGRVLDAIELEHGKTRQTIEGLELTIAAATPIGEGGKVKGCGDALKEWRAEPGK
jgi:hypothetical protein